MRPDPTSHAGSLPRPNLDRVNERARRGDFTEEAEYPRQAAPGGRGPRRAPAQNRIDLVNDGEFGHSMGHEKPNYLTAPGGASTAAGVGGVGTCTPRRTRDRLLDANKPGLSPTR